MLDHNRLCLLRVLLTDQTYRVGTGYAISNRFVLTAQHILPSDLSLKEPKELDNLEVEVLFPSLSEEWHPASPVWLSNPEQDACLLTLPDDLVTGAPPTLGRFDRSRLVPWQSAGFPQAASIQMGEIDFRDVAGLSGTLTPEGAIRRGYLELTVEAAPETEDWHGLSGAPVFAEGRLLGFVRSTTAAFQGQRLLAVSVESLLEETAFSDALNSPRTGRVPRGVLQLPESSPQPAHHNPSSLLLARHRQIPFVPELQASAWKALQQWCLDDTSPNSVRLFVGPGGSGKTRLLLEWCLLCEDEHNWSTGFLPDELTSEQWKQLHTSGRSTLVVIDYAETRPHLSQDLIKLLERQALPRLRVALLARDTGDWWDALPQQLEHVRHVVDETEQGSLTHRLQPIAMENSQRHQVLMQAYRVFALPGSPPPMLIPSLQEPQFGCILYLHAAALALQERRSSQTMSLSANSVLEQTLDREEKYWRQATQQEWPNDRARRNFTKTARLWFTALTLRGGIQDEEEGEALHKKVKGPDDWDILSEELYPGDGTHLWLRGLEPDLLGEALVYRTLSQHKRPIAFLHNVLEDAAPSSIQFGLTVLSRIAMQYPAESEPWLKKLLSQDLGLYAVPAFNAALTLGRQTAFAPLGQWLADLLREQGDLHLAQELAPRLRRRSISMQEVALWVKETQLQHLSQSTDKDPDEYIDLLRECSRQHSQIGQHKEALDLIQEAVMLCRQFPSTQENLARLAQHLRTLSGCFGRLERHEEALQVIKESTELHRQLHEKAPDTYTRELATSLHSLSVQHSFSEQSEAALEAITEAVQLRRLLFEQRPQHFRAVLASSLSQWGIQLDKAKEHGKALEAEMEAVVHRKALATMLPDVYLPDYAQSLTSLSIRYSRSKQREEALEAAQQAVVILQDCTQAQPETFVTRLLTYSKNLQRRLWESKLEPKEDATLLSAVGLLRQQIEAGYLDGRRLGTLKKIGLKESEEG